MKYILEFGNRGGAHVDNVEIPSLKLAQKLARCLVMTFTNDCHATGATQKDWEFPRGVVRAVWKDANHFVAVSKLDGIPRGPAANNAWRKNASLLEGTVAYYTAGDC